MGIKDLWKESIFCYAVKDWRFLLFLGFVMAAFLLSSLSREVSGTAKWLLFAAAMACAIPMSFALWKMLRPIK